MTLTLDISPLILARAEARAAREGVTLDQLVGQIVREHLDRRERDEAGGAAAGAQEGATPAPASSPQRAFPPLPVFAGGGFPPNIDPRSNPLPSVADAGDDTKYVRIARGELL